MTNGIAELDPLLRMRLLWAAFLGSLAIYLVVLLVVSPGPREVSPVIVAALTAASVVCAAAAACLRRLARATSAAHPPDPARRVLLDLLAYALIEAIAIYGLVLAFLGGGTGLLLPFWGVSAAGLLLVFPRAADYGRQR